MNRKQLLFIVISYILSMLSPVITYEVTKDKWLTVIAFMPFFIITCIIVMYFIVIVGVSIARFYEWLGDR